MGLKRCPDVCNNSMNMKLNIFYDGQGLRHVIYYLKRWKETSVVSLFKRGMNSMSNEMKLVSKKELDRLKKTQLIDCCIFCPMIGLKVEGYPRRCDHPYWDDHNGSEDFETGYGIPILCPLRIEDLTVIYKAML